MPSPFLTRQLQIWLIAGNALLALFHGTAARAAAQWQMAPALEGEVQPLLLLERHGGPALERFVPEPQSIATRVVKEDLELTITSPEEITALLVDLGIAPPSHLSAQPKVAVDVNIPAPYESRGATDKEVMKSLGTLLRGGSFSPRKGSEYFVVTEVLAASRVSLRIPLSLLPESERSSWLPALAAAQTTSPGVTVTASAESLLVHVSLPASRVLAFSAERVTFSQAATGVPLPTLRGSSKIVPQASHLRTPTLTETGRDYLVRGHDERPGAGLYSYLLFHSAPSGQAQRNQYLTAIEAFLRIEPAELLATEIAAETLNRMYLPLDAEPSGSPDAEWLLAHYDHVRAQALLSKFSCRGGAGAESDLGRSSCGPWLDGPYVLSYWEPLSSIEMASKPAFFQDWTDMPPDVISPWMRAFREMVLTGSYGASEEQAALPLKIRTGLSKFTAALGQLRSAAPEIATLAADLETLTKEGARILGLVWPP